MVYMHVCLYITCVPGAQEARKEHYISLELKLYMKEWECDRALRVLCCAFQSGFFMIM